MKDFSVFKRIGVIFEIMSSAMRRSEGGIIPAEITGIRFVFLEPGVNNSNAASSYIGVYSIELHNQGDYYPNTSVVATASSEYSSIYSANSAIDYTNNTTSHYWCTTYANNGNPDRSCWIQLTFPKRQITGFDVYFHQAYQCKNFDVEVQLPTGEWVYVTTMRRSTPWNNITNNPIKVYIRNNKAMARQSSMAFNEQGLNLPVNLGPGPQELIGYYIDPENPFRQHGFFGEISSNDFITGDALASAVGLSSAGTSMNSTTAWFKFVIDGKIVFVPKLSLRHSITWEQIYQAGCVYSDGTTGLYPSGTPVVQNKQVTAGGSLFKVGLLSGANVDPHPNTTGSDLVSTHGCEWNRLFYNIVVPNATYPQTSQEGPDWATYTESELGITVGSGRFTLCKESHAVGATYRVVRGNVAVITLNRYTVSIVGNNLGWRPKLELYNLHEI